MAIRSVNATKDYLTSVSLPQYEGDSYTVISHGFVIDKTLEELKNKGFEIERELYRCNKSANIAQGVYHLKYGSDPEMGMMFAWSNSYDKTMRFKCAIGGYVFVCMNGMVSGNMGSWARRHSGTADVETSAMITDQIANADVYYNQLVQDKIEMKNVILTPRQQAEIMGRIYFEHGLLSSEQLSIVKAESKKPTFDYNADKDSLWQLYNGITLSLQKSHPKTWMDQQRMIHWLVMSDYTGLGLVGEMKEAKVNLTPSNQLNLLDMIAEAESEVEQLYVNDNNQY